MEEQSKMSDGKWYATAVINTPKGEYECQSDDLLREIQGAAAFAGLRSFYVSVRRNGESTRVERQDLQTNSVDALVAQVSIEGTNEGTPVVASVTPYDKAAC